MFATDPGCWQRSPTKRSGPGIAPAVQVRGGAPSILRRRFPRLGEGGRVVEDLQTRPWGASDGRVIDRYGLGFEDDESD